MLRKSMLIALVAIAACSSNTTSPGGIQPGGSDAGPADTGTMMPASYRATIQRTSYGIPHITADDLGSLGFGVGYAAAKDYGCVLLDQLVRTRSERAKVFGPGPNDANISSDLAFLALGVKKNAAAAIDRIPRNMRELMDGYVAGFNRYLEVTGVDNLPEPCKGARWITPATIENLIAYTLFLSMQASGDRLMDLVVGARPPGRALRSSGAAEGEMESPIDLPDFRNLGFGSNGWAIGRDRSLGHRGMLVGNPHFPWEGPLRFWEFHVTVPGTIDAYGAGLTGSPIPQIGFNKDLAWTHMVSTGIRFTAYKLKLSANDPTIYMYDGQPRPMVKEDFTVDVLGANGEITRITRSLYRSHYGPIIAGAGLPWTDQVAFTYRDANDTNTRLIEQWFRIQTSKSLDELEAAHREVHAVPWVYTVSADKDGTVLFLDGSRVPRLSPAASAAYLDARRTDVPTRTLAGLGIVLLDGSTSRDEWVDSGEPTAAGLIPFAEMPKVMRTDFVANGNNTPWLPNPASPLVDYALGYGPSRDPLPPRPRMNLILLSETGPGTASGEDGLFSFEELRAAILSNRGGVAELVLPEVVARCAGARPVTVMGEEVDITPACAALAGWDGRLDLDSRGGLLWREFLSAFDNTDLLDAGNLFAMPFDPDNPLRTPNTLRPRDASLTDPIHAALAGATLRLRRANLEPNVRVRDAQYTTRGDHKIPIHGGTNLDGTSNIVDYSSENDTLYPLAPRPMVLNSRSGLTTEGYLINRGSSFIIAVEFTDAGPHAQAFLTYSESNDPSSPHYFDQTERFSRKDWRPILFTRRQIMEDPELSELTVEARR